MTPAFEASPIGAALLARPLDSPMLCGDGGTMRTADVIRHAERLAPVTALAGLAPHSRVCVVMPNDTRLAATAIALLATATFAPLDPRLSPDEVALALDRLGADGLVSIEGFAPQAHAAAVAAGLAVIDAASDGTWRVVNRLRKQRGQDDEPIALMLQTSGTTAEPKLIGLTSTNLMASADAIAATLRLDADDRCLNVMPLFHIHGLVGVLLSSLVSGASVELVERFEPGSFGTRLGGPGVTWTSAVPSIYQATLRRRAPAGVAGLRFVRSSSAAMPVSVARDVESVLGCPLVVAYGMTEASHQMTSNPLPPGERRAGTVGLPAGAEVRILANGSLTAVRGVRGEVVVRGPGIMSRYLAPPGADAEAWCDGWFRTGDVGVLDGDGYLTLEGRLKEIINVAGEKVSPFQIEEVILEHPSVGDAVAFAAPDGLRGERVAVTVVPAAGHEPPSAAEIKAFCSERLARFKVPHHVVVAESIPLGPTGKVQRSRLAAHFGLDAAAPGSPGV